jgi:plastocyanin
MSGTLKQLVNRSLMVLGAVLVVATGVVFVDHESQAGVAAAQQPGEPAKAGNKVEIKDFLYEPAAITVAVGTKLTFTNKDGAPHTATSGSSPTADGVFETGTLKQGQAKGVTLTKAGTFAYYCAIHPFMKATVVVK